MAGNREKVVVAMSGGVDSSVAACLLKEQDYDVIGLFMRVGVEEPQESVEEARYSGATGPGAPGSTSATHSGEAVESETCSPSACPPASRVGMAPGLPDLDPLADERSRGLKPAAREEDREHARERPREHQGCCSASDAADARFVAGMLEVPFYALNFQADFDRIIDYFVDEYVAGKTPNPCVVCNDRLKFGKLVDYADAVGAKYIATGHYARIGTRDGQKVLMRGLDLQKDQSYVLFGMERTLLDRVLFPIGELEKSEVRDLATRFDLPNRAKPDSVEICFVPDRDYARVVRERRPEAFVEGDVVDADGKVMGRHQGIPRLTIGQRRGLGIAAGKPIYVTQLDTASNTVTMGDADALLASGLIAERANFLAEVPETSFRATVKIRYLHTPTPATVELIDDGKIRVRFDEPQRAITPGQAVVFYDGDVVLGGAWIDRVEREEAADTSAVSKKVAPLPAPLLYKEGQKKVLSRLKNPPQSPLGKGGRKQDDLLGKGTNDSTCTASSDES